MSPPPEPRPERDAASSMPVFRPTKVRIAFGIALAVLSASGILLTWEISRTWQITRRVWNSRDVIDGLDRVFVAFRDSVAASRGYAPDALQMHRQSVESVRSALSDVRQGITANPDQQRRLKSLETAFDQTVALERRRLEAVAEKGPDFAYEVFRQGQGELLDDEIRRIITGMKSAEDSVLQRQRQEQDRRTRKAEILFASSVVLGLIILLAVYYHLEREIRRRQRSERRLIHLNRLYICLSQSNQGIVRARTRDELFGEVCRVAVQDGQFAVAWIGTPEPETGGIKLVAAWGREEGDSRDVWAAQVDQAEYNGPIACAMREGQRFVCNDVAADPRKLPWRERALARGCHSAAALPIKLDGRVVGGFCLLADHTDYFDDESLRLLDEVTSDISFALQKMDQEEQRRIAEGEVRRLNQQLEHRVLERTSQLGDANCQLAKQNEELARASRLKSEFLARMSHEFRTPLNSIIGFTDLLAEQGEGPLEEAYADYVRHVHEGAHHLLSLVNDILDLSRIEAGRIELRHEEFAAAEAVTEVLAVIAPLAEAKNIEVGTGMPPALLAYGDRTRFTQILYNLLSNAVKFTPAAGRVQVSAQSDYGEIRFCVSDTGIGIPPEQHAAIFEEFTQVAPAASGVKEGAGLGLTITKRIVELQGGRIWVDSTPGEGSRFYFTVPAARAGQPGSRWQSSSTV